MWKFGIDASSVLEMKSVFDDEWLMKRVKLWSASNSIQMLLHFQGMKTKKMNKRQLAHWRTKTSIWNESKMEKAVIK